MDRRLEAELLEVARSAIDQEVRARGWHYDASQVEMLRSPKPHDLDRDGKEEFCFVAGIPVFSGPAFCGLCVPSRTGGYRVLALHEFEAGFRNMSVSDVNEDGVAEVVTLWQDDYGLNLTLRIQQWDGTSVRSLFPRQRFHQGFMEMKDLDADGVDEIAIWSGRYESNPRWGPQFFDIHVFRYNGDAYQLQQSRRSERRYLPSAILGQRIGIAGVPTAYERPPSPTEQRRRLQEHVASNGGEAKPTFLEEMGTQSSLLHDEGLYEEALGTLDVVFEGIEHLSDLEARLVVSYEAWAARATNYAWIGRWPEAVNAYRQAINLYDQGASARIDSQQGPGRRRELAFTYHRGGEYGEALRWLSDAEAALEEANLPENKYRDELGRIRSLSGLARAELGDYEQAKSDLLEASVLHEGLGRYPQAAISRTGLGNVLRDEAQIRESGFGEAIGAYEAALDNLNRLEGGTRDSKDREADAYLQLGRTLMLDGKPDAAIGFLEKALLLTSVPNLVHHAAVHYLYIGEAYADLGDPEPAERFLSKAVALADAYGTPETRWRALHKLALVQRDGGRIGEAEGTLKRCIETIESLRSQHLPEATKISMLSPKERPYEDLVILLCESETQGAAGVDARAHKEAYDYVERAKSRVFAERLANTDFGSSGLPADLLQEDRRLTRELSVLQARYKADEPRRYDWVKEAAEAERELRELRTRIGESGIRGREYVSLRQASPLGYDGVRAVLERLERFSGTAARGGSGRAPLGRVVLAEYFATDDKVLLFVGRSDLEAPRLYEFAVSRDDLWWWRRMVFEELDDPSDWDLSEWQKKLGPLVEPLARWAEEGDVVWMVLHGDLHRLPLHALAVEGHYLIERNPVFYTPSASVMPYCEAKGSGRRQTALVMGDSLGDLRHAGEEARTVADAFGTEPYLGDRATKAVLKTELEVANGSIDVLHFACHGRFEANDPLESRILLAPRLGDDTREARRVEERDLTAREILGLRIRADLVTMSACESGLSERHPGDELTGLIRSLLYAGTPSVVASLWRVDDASTGALMGCFYSGLLSVFQHGGGGPAALKARALQAAQRYVMGLGGFRHPFYWASFVLVGDFR